MSINKIRLPDNTEHTLDAELLDGYSAQKYYPTVAYNFTTGCFCKTSLTSTATVVYIEIFGRKHGTTTGGFYFVQARAYWYNGAFQSGYNQAIRYGESIGDITFFRYDGKLCFWFKVATGSCSFYVTCRAGSAGRNYVTEITNETIPADATGNTVVTPTVAFSDTYLSATAPAAGITATDITNWNGSILPTVTSSQNGQALVVSGGAWAVGEPSGIYALRERRYIHSTSTPLHRYKFCGYDGEGKLVPLTVTDQTDTTIVQKTPTSVGIDPSKGIIYYGSTTDVTDVSTAVGSIYPTISNSACAYNFNANAPANTDVYLKGTYSASTGLFTLDTTSNTSWYVFAPNLSADGTYTSVFTDGYYYIYVGPTYTLNNYIHLEYNNPLYYYNGTRLIPVNLDSRIPSFISGSSAPTSSQGNDGDIYIQTS